MKLFTPQNLFESSSIFPTCVAAYLRGGYATIPANPLAYMRMIPYIMLSRKKNAENLFDRNLSLYDGGNYNFIVIGSGCGGTANLCTCIKAPLLPIQTLILKPKLNDPDDVDTYAERSLRVARNLIGRNPGVEAVIHYDPIHDRPVVRLALIVRLKLASLPKCYQEFIRKNLARDGTVVFIRCSYEWEWYKLDEGVWLQVGGYGAVSWREYKEGSQRIDEWLEKIGEKHRGGWKLDYPSEIREESEWGTPRKIEESVREFCEAHGNRFMSIEFHHPCDISLFSSELWRRKNVESNGFMVDCFWTFSPVAAAKSRMIPYWTVWPDEGTLRMAEQHISKMIEWDVPRRATFARHPAFGPDIVGIDGWEKMLRRYFESLKLYGHLSNDIYHVSSLAAIMAIRKYVIQTTKEAERTRDESERIIDLDELTDCARSLGIAVRSS